jgi:hypothetical protein
MSDVEGFDESDNAAIKNDFAYHNNVAGAAKHIRLGGQLFLRIYIL